MIMKFTTRRLIYVRSSSMRNAGEDAVREGLSATTPFHIKVTHVSRAQAFLPDVMISVSLWLVRG